MSDTITTPEYVLWAYRLLLGREPDSPASVYDWPDVDRREIVARFLASPEFQDKNESSGFRRPGENAWFIGELENGIRFWLCHDDNVISPHVARGSYKPAETAFLRRQVQRGMNVLDIGANIGWFTVNMAMLVGPGGRVDAFEPRDDVARYLRRTLAENKLTNALVHCCALAAENGEGLIAFAEQDSALASAHLMVGDEAPAGEATQPVPLRRLDLAIWGGVDFIKIDAAGAERLVLDGGDIVIGRDRPVILSAVNEALLQRTSRISVPDYFSYFEEIEYEVRRILPNGRCGEPAFYRDVEDAGGSLSVGCVPAEKSQDVLSR